MVPPHAIWEVVKVVHSHPRFRVGFLSLAGFVTLRYTLWNLYLYWRMQKKMDARKKQAHQRKLSVKEQCKNSNPADIMEKSISDLIKEMKNGTLTAVEVLRAFQKRALELDEIASMITETIPEALGLAKELDQASVKNELLHGIPVSLKENVGIAGYDQTGGVGYFLDKIVKEDSIAVKVLKMHGAIPFVRTNIPQTMMSYCSSNPIYGETSNPHDLTRGPGGSSSGEGALIGGGGSFIGIGTDVGGSVRVPAAFCGCYSLKPTNRRVSYKGVRSMSRGNLVLQGSIGPIAKDWESLVLISKALMSKEMYELDPELAPIPFDQELLDNTKPMRIGYYVHDGNVRCHSSVVRGVMEAKAALEKMGHKVVPIDLNKMSSPGFHVSYFLKHVMPDRAQLYRELLVHDKLEKSLKFVSHLARIPPWLIKIISVISSFKDKLFSDVMKGAVGHKSLYGYLSDISVVRDWQDQFMTSWLDMKLDAVICPTWPSAAPKKNNLHLLAACGCYSQLYNCLNYPSGVVPVTKVTKSDIQQTLDKSEYKPSSLAEKLLLKSVEGSEGMPIGIQCVALPFREEICLRVMRDVEKGLRA